MRGCHDPDAALTYYKNLAWHFDYDEEVLRAYIDGLCQMDDLMKYLGAEEPFLQENGSVVTPEYPEYKGGESIVEWYVRKGMYTSSLWQTIRAAVVDRKDAIDVWLESPATRLVQDPQSRTIVGVEIDKKGEKVLVRALNGVVLCCGGFENNGAMIQDYLGAARLAPIGTLHNNGDGVRMGIEVGADLWHMEAYESLGILCGNAWAPEEGQRALLEASLLPRAPYISLNSEHYGEGSIFLVGDDGGRFVDEYAWHRHGHQYSNGVWRNPVANYAPWLIFDGVQYEQLKADGYITEEREAKLVTASTPEELAAKIGVDSAILAQTVEDFNDFVEGGRDYTCGRDTSSMRAFDGQTYTRPNSARACSTRRAARAATRTPRSSTRRGNLSRTCTAPASLEASRPSSTTRAATWPNAWCSARSPARTRRPRRTRFPPTSPWLASIPLLRTSPVRPAT